MSRGPVLPVGLQRELGLESQQSRRGNGVRTRKEERRAGRVEKRQQPVMQQRRQGGLGGVGISDASAKEEATNIRTTAKRPKVDAKAASSRRPQPHESDSEDSYEDEGDGDVEEDDDVEQEQEQQSDEDVYERLYRGSSPEVVLDANSRSYKDRQAEEDADVAALEKKLGLRGKKRKGPDDDGLANILGDFDEGDKDSRTQHESVEWLRSKRQKALQRQEESDEDESDDESDNEEGSEGVPLQEDFEGFESDEADEPLQEDIAKRVRENPYVAPVSSTAKYVPPSLRKAQSESSEATLRLRRQLQGHLNKLSEANLISIVTEVESMYRTNARGDVTNILIDLLLNLFTTPSTLSNTFIILHAAFATALYRLIGVDFGAQLISSLVDRFLDHHQNTTTATTTPKEPLNLLSWLSYLFTFSLVASPLITSLISRLLEPLTETNAELLLRIIRDCGPQLRSTDPTALKTIVFRTSAAVEKLQAGGQTISVRTKFMLETIKDLKNNKLRHSTADVGASREHITRMKKALGSMSNRTLRATEPLRIDLSDILDSDRKGKWWLVGASWKGHDADAPPMGQLTEQADVSIPALASSLRLNTPLQHTILSAIANSLSGTMAHEHIIKLNLKNAQIPEIPVVVLRCCAAEPDWNPFYAQLATRLCVYGSKAARICKAWQFAVWGYLRNGLDEITTPDDDEAGGGLTSMAALSNTARLTAALIHAGHLSLSVLRTVDLHLLKDDSKAQLWVELLLVQLLVLCKGDEAMIGRIFKKLDATPQVVPRLRVFMRKYVKSGDLAEDKEGKRLVKFTKAMGATSAFEAVTGACFAASGSYTLSRTTYFTTISGYSPLPSTCVPVQHARKPISSAANAKAQKELQIWRHPASNKDLPL
ncbi:Suppressor of glycerol defect protein 1 [Cyphellophora attinorum]|uniref:Suppressor of glycerol defect protein 1 n=1 Tax=Cyphellophora attinorum TaxID=1664694 RepID=A0A0N0NML0_9EURO|nr:Suppressor of glycerol defect protein 1 [Phialophora attinorum]KPI40329.1 Suppressor of glycerol defect protein 1 [Phialophora attinorum]